MKTRSVTEKCTSKLLSRRQWARFSLAICGFAALPMSAQAATEIQFWHSMGGKLGDWVNDMAAGFNKTQSDYKVVPVYKGTYGESMTAGIAAFRAGNAPHILQVFEVGTATMMASKGAIVPVAQMMKEAGEPFDPKAYVPAVAGYYTNRKGEMLSFPFNSSTTVFYYNKDVFQKAGVRKIPETWSDVALAGALIKSSGAAKCAYTSSWVSWVHLENFSAWHNVPIATANNGFDSPDAKLLVNTPLHQKHIGNLEQWSKQGLFTYGGRAGAADSKFHSGECAMFTGSSAAYANIKANAKFNFGIAKLPHYSDVPGAPQNTIIGGASLWVMAGKKKEDYKGVAKFFNYIASPELQAQSHQMTGYLPITSAAYELTKKSGFYEKNPGTDVSVQQMIVKTTDKSRGLRLGNFVQIRTIIDEELEGVWAGKQDAKTALGRIEQRGNEQLARFARTAKE